MFRATLLVAAALLLFLAGAGLLAVLEDHLLKPPAPSNEAETAYAVLRGHRHWVMALAFSPDGTVLASASGEIGRFGDGKLWDVANAQLLADLAGQTGSLHALAFTPDGRTLLAGGWDSPVRSYDPTTGQERGQRTRQLSRVQHIAGLPGGGMRVVAHDPRGPTVRVWDVAASREVLTCRGLPPSVLSPDGRLLAAEASGSRSVLLREVAAGPDKHISLEIGSSNVYALAFSPDGHTLAVGCADGTVGLWDVTTGELLVRYPAHADSISAVAFSPDSQLVASASNDRTIKLQEAATGRQCGLLRGHTGTVYCLAFSPDGRHLASGGFDKTVRLWTLHSPVSTANVLRR